MNYLLSKQIVLDGVPQANMFVHISTLDGTAVTVYDSANDEVGRPGMVQLDADGELNVYVRYFRQYRVLVVTRDGRPISRDPILAHPALTMPSQAFLPVMTVGGEVAGMLPLDQATAYDSRTATVTVNGVVYDTRVRHVTAPAHSNGTPFDTRRAFYLSADISDSDYRAIGERMPAGMDQLITYTRWVQPLGSVAKQTGIPTFVAFFLSAAGSMTTPTNDPLAGDDIGRVWHVNMPATNASTLQCSFLDVNWQAESGVAMAPYRPVSATVGAPTADPGNGAALRAFIVQAGGPNIVNGVGVNSTVRVVRVTPGAVPVGVYTWPITVTDDQGNTVTFDLTVHVQ